ncbi:hypothetical protein MKW94_014840 [Papaver nudicaule]|uniref:DUF2470 domain-containing protein n=1 Tax=Papaver nudicaule TaxID=74823 RepID=A0AA41VQT4_PAPNU|nr:hypothetical protein [Papaver nudicaule]
MLPQVQSLSPGYSPSILPATSHFSTTKLISFSTTLSSIKPFTKNTKFSLSKNNSCLNSSIKPLGCSVSVISELTQIDLQKKPSPAEVARTIMELSCVGTLSTLTSEGSPLGTGVRFAVDSNGTPIFCLNSSDRRFSLDRKSSLHVQFEQSGTRTTQCTLQGSLDKPEDRAALQNFHSIWEKRFDEEVDPDLIYVVSVEKILQKEDFKEDGIWVDSSEYNIANPDPLRDSAKNIVSEINTNHKEDFERICSVYVDLEVTHAKAIWVDRLGFDVHIHSERAMFEVRIPFPREVTDEKGAKSSFNCMSQLAWEVEKSYTIPDFEKGKLLKQIR